MTAPPSNETDAAELTLSILEQLPDPADPADVDDALAVLSNRRRRLTLAVVRDHGEALALPDVADEVAVAERGRPLSAIDPETVTEIYVGIYHDHLPRLVDVGLLSYDQERDLVIPNFESCALPGDDQP
ncbi:DUF7344 domain-containing protein [Halovivax limisalsi]|uniref:DUF7344 domain-containing protein n=1 Tax=Halovivax limisalsi TaxID=1453760 RepID=UPI001FFDBDAF|nr:hypothetical protein [Halovivax limisalsi]